MKHRPPEPSFVTCETEYGAAYGWRIDHKGITVITDSRKECKDAWHKAWEREQS